MRKSIVIGFLAIILSVFFTYAQNKPRQTEPVSLRFAVLGDTGTGGSAQYDIARRLTAARSTFPFELVLLLGDNMYGGESPRDFESKFEKPYRPLLDAGVKFYATLGNHDQPARQILYKLFNMQGKKYYSFKPRPDIRVFALDSNYMDTAQLDWFENELKSSGSDWKIAFFHHPLYSSGEKHGSDLELRAVIEPLMIKYGVDIVFSGHEHFYERLKPQKGINYITLGSSAKLRQGNIAVSPMTARGFDDDNVFMLAEIAGDELRFRVISRAGRTVDSGIFRRAEQKRTVISGR
jgi:hypothetical protein